MADKIIQILPHTDTKGLDEVIVEQNAYYGKPVDTSKMVFVFGSNRGGRHGAGAARYAHKHKGAIYGQPWGIQGMSFAIPTMDAHIKPLSLPDIDYYVKAFINYAKQYPTVMFQVTCIGCGLGGQKHEDIAPMFLNAPENCYFDTLWKEWLPNAKFWGTF